MLKVITLLVIIIIAAIVVSYFAFGYLPREPAASGNGGGTFPPPTTPSSPTTSTSPGTPSSPKPPPTQAATTKPAPPPTPTPAAKTVAFEVAITDVTGSGFSRTVTAQMKNAGQADAHNTWVKVEVFAGTSKVKLGGEDYLRIDLGTVGAGQTLERQVTLSFSLMDGLKLSQSGATFKLTITSDEHTDTLTYDYTP